MKTEDILKKAIYNRNKIEFDYNRRNFTLEPYYISKNKFGKTVIFGRVNNSHRIQSFESELIENIRLLDYEQFSPLIPILPQFN